MFGFGFTFGDSNFDGPSNPFIGTSDYFFDPERYDHLNFTEVPFRICVTRIFQNEKGQSYALFIFQMSFATTTSTIVSGR